MTDQPQEASKPVSVRAVMRSLKIDMEGMFQMGDDGVLRSFDGPFNRNVLDAVGLSPAQIKELLDTQEWSQENGDKFRGVDGRQVTDHQALYHPQDNYRPKKYTSQEDWDKDVEEIQRKNRELSAKIEKEKAEGVDVEAKYACQRAVSDHDLTPRKTA